MIRHFMAVAVHGPKKVLFKPMRMAVRLDHLQMIVDRFKDRGGMGKRGHDGPEDQGKARQNCKKTPAGGQRASHGPAACCERRSLSWQRNASDTVEQAEAVH